MGIRDVAKASGVSPSTAALALKGGPGVAAETVALVQRVARQLKYRPGRAGRPRRLPDDPRSLRRTNRLALVSWRMPEAWLNTPVYMAVIRGVEEGAYAHGKALVLRHIPPESALEGQSPTPSVDGLILFGRPAGNEQSQFRQLPCVRIMGADVGRSGPWDHITYDDEQVGVIAADYLIKRGHSHVAFIGNRPAEGSRGASFLQRSKDRGVEASLLSTPRPLLVVSGPVQTANGAAFAELVETWLALELRPTGLFVHADAIAQALQPALIARGMRPGREVELISCNNEQILLSGLVPRPATVDIHAEAIGRRAVEQLLARIENPGLPRLTMAMEPELIAGDGE